MRRTQVIAPVGGRAVALPDVPDPVFSQGMVGYGAAVDPPHAVVDVVSPVAGTVRRVMPHAFVVVTADGVGVLVHLGLDTVGLAGVGFTGHAVEGDQVAAGQIVVTYDVPAIVAAGLQPVIPVVVMDERDPGNVVAAEAVLEGADVDTGAALFTVVR
jgi:sugar PTS system EIIA component